MPIKSMSVTPEKEFSHMPRIIPVLVSAALATLSLAAEAQQNQGAMAGMGGMGGSRLGGYTEPPPAGRVPDHPLDIVLGRPTDDSVTVSALVYDDREAYVAYGSQSGDYDRRTEPVQLAAGEPLELALTGLAGNTRYYYRLRHRGAGEESYESTGEYSFHTQRQAGDSFVFTIQSDSHLDENTDGAVYANTLTNALADRPDFHVAMGDAFMTGKYIDYRNSEAAYLAQRYYFGLLSHSAPLFFALGNHDGERGNQNPDMVLWSANVRKKYFPNPFPDGFYSGNEVEETGIGLVEDYYTWEWGNSLFVVLDPFRYELPRSEDNWWVSLGSDQYEWLRQTLAGSDATFKFVFIHHLVGGIESNRGGAEASQYFEWGGKDFDGNDRFAQERPGWEMPIHDLLVRHDVSIVFHGHDHMYIQQEREGIVYQLMPQPGHPRGSINSAESYGYLSGTAVAGSGHVRVAVAEDEVRVDYIRSALPGNALGSNREIVHTYTLDAR